MKKLIYFIALFISLQSVTWMTSCGDNDDFYAPHVLSADEIAQIRYQDSIDSVRRTMIDADKVFKFKISDVTTPDGIWINKPLYIDLDAVGEVFGLTAQELANGIVKGTVKGCAMDAVTHVIRTVSSTTGGIIGHWWTDKGDVGTWSDNLASLVVFCEWQCWELGEDGNADLSECFYRVGQFPGRLEQGFGITFYEGMQYEDKRVIFQVNYRIPDPNKAEIIAEENIEINLPPNPKGYNLIPVGFNYQKMLSTLDLESVNPQENLITYDAEHKFTTSPTADNGFWFDANGSACAFKDGKVEVVYPGSADDPTMLGVCLRPKNTAVGDVYKQDFGFFADGYIYMIHLTINVTEE